jgi:hypothetical protein
MDLIIFKSIVYGELKPWASNAINEKFYRQNMFAGFMKPTHTINQYYKQLKELHKDKQSLFSNDGLEIYSAQPDTDIHHEILHPLVEVSLAEPITTTQKFYHYLLYNEATRLTDRVFKCMNKDIGEIQKKELIQNVVKSCKDLLFCIGTDQQYFQKDELTFYVVPQLITNTIRFLKETELLYPQYLADLPSTKNELYGELLQRPIPNDAIDKTTPEFQTVNNILLGNDNYKFEKNTRLSFGFNGNTIKLKSVIQALNRNIELLNEDHTTIDNLVSVLTSRDLKIGAAQIHLGCETTQFSYIISKLEHYFSNFNPTSIEQSNLFYSKKGTVLKRNNLYKNNNKFPKEQDNIDEIIKQL